MKAPSPAFSFYPKDWLSDINTRTMTYEEKGVYIDLLAIVWHEDVPADPEHLHRLLKIPANRFAKVWPAISRCFFIESGFLRQKRIERERSKQVERSRLQSEKGIKSAKSRKYKAENQPRLDSGCDSEATQFNLSSSSSSSSSTQQQQQQQGAREAARRDSSWIDFDATSELQATLVKAVEDLAEKQGHKTDESKRELLRALSHTPRDGAEMEGSIRHVSKKWISATLSAIPKYDRDQNGDSE